MRSIPLTVALGVAGFLAAAGIGVAANAITGDSVGLSAEPLAAGEDLAPAAASRTREEAEQAEDRLRATRRKRARERAREEAAAQEAPAAPATRAPAPAVPPPTDDDGGDDNSGSGSSGSGSDDDSGQGRVRGGDD